MGWPRLLGASAQTPDYRPFDPKGHRVRPVGAAGVRAESTTLGGSFTASTRVLHYYCGEAVPEAYKATLTAAPDQPSGTTYTWNVTGPARVRSGQGTSQCVLEGYGESAPDKPEGDIIVTLTYSIGQLACTSPPMKFVSLKPRLVNGPMYQDSAWPNGYQTIALYDIVDQFDKPMAVPKSEYFLNDCVDEQPNNWPTPVQGGHPSPEAIYHDAMRQAGSSLNPAAFYQQPLGSDGVFYHTQKLLLGYGGSYGTGGCVGRVHKQHWYRDHARHE